MRGVNWVVVGILVASWAVGPAYAGQGALYGVDVVGGWGGDSTLVIIDVQTGAATPVGPIEHNGANVGTLEGLAWDAGSGTLYGGGSWVGQPLPGSLWGIDPQTAKGGFLGVVTVGGSPISGFESLAWGDGMGLYGSTGPELIKVDANTTTATVIGNFGGPIVEALSFDAAGLLWGAADMAGFYGAKTLVKINPGNGLLTVVGFTGLSDIDGLAWLPDGRLVATDSVADSLYALNPQTGAASLIGSYSFDFIAPLAYVPEPATLALFAFGALVAVKRRG